VQAKISIGIILATSALVACGPKRPESQTKDAGMGTRYEPEQSSMGESEIAKEEVDDGTREFDQDAADVALKRGARKVKECAKSADAPAGTAEVEVVFDGEKGRITEVRLPTLWEDAPDRGKNCIKNSWMGEYVPPFDGGPQNRSIEVEIPEKGAADKDEKKK
jgi:hypothetical protein